MSKHSTKEAQIVAAYLKATRGVEYFGWQVKGGEYQHEFAFMGAKARYRHGGQRPTTPSSVFEKDAKKGVYLTLVSTGRQALADQWATK